MTVVAVNEEQAEDWNGASGREFIEQRERHERMRGRLTARLLASAQIQDGENILDIGCGCGDVTILCWRTREENPFFTTGFAEAAAVLGFREPPGPGAAFSLADTGRVGALLSGAGFGGIEFAKADEPMLIGRDVHDVLEYERASPSASEVLAGLSPAQAAELARQVRDRLVTYASPDGVTMPGAAWLVTAQAA